MIGLVERCLRDGDDAAWVELWQVLESASVTEVRRILAEHGVPPEDADAVVTKCWERLTGSGSIFGDTRAPVAGEPLPPKTVPDPLGLREAVISQGDASAAVAGQSLPLKTVHDRLEATPKTIK